MKKIFRCYYLTFKNTDDVSGVCSFIDKIDNKPNIYDYLSIVMCSDIYHSKSIENYINITTNSEQNPEQIFNLDGINFYLIFHQNQVTFLHNMFDELDGWPDLSCPLHIFKQVITAWSLFLQLPKSKHTLLETEIFEEDPSLKSRND